MNQTIFDYQTIATATGKDGIQALLIEEAIPEIEHEANYLLSRLTNNQAQIFIESLRDLKKGGTKETLDIKISDPAGIRALRDVFGRRGIQDRLCLRIAVSKLLARRAGTALQTLIIDEGFGSQDDEGLSNIMDCIHKIQDDFSLIIIVSHLSTMKDQFPVHFMVEKRAQASRVHVVDRVARTYGSIHETKGLALATNEENNITSHLGTFMPNNDDCYTSTVRPEFASHASPELRANDGE